MSAVHIASCVLDAIDAIGRLEGVLAVHLGYQHAEPANEMEKDA